ncbi:MAG: hypothetical protein MHM6MM_007376 [Cercozoa sp. M6MM]
MNVGACMALYELEHELHTRMDDLNTLFLARLTALQAGGVGKPPLTQTDDIEACFGHVRSLATTQQAFSEAIGRALFGEYSEEQRAEALARVCGSNLASDVFQESSRQAQCFADNLASVERLRNSNKGFAQFLAENEWLARRTVVDLLCDAVCHAPQFASALQACADECAHVFGNQSSAYDCFNKAAAWSRSVADSIAGQVMLLPPVARVFCGADFSSSARAFLEFLNQGVFKSDLQLTVSGQRVFRRHFIVTLKDKRSVLLLFNDMVLVATLPTFRGKPGSSGHKFVQKISVPLMGMQINDLPTNPEDSPQMYVVELVPVKHANTKAFQLRSNTPHEKSLLLQALREATSRV